MLLIKKQVLPIVGTLLLAACGGSGSGSPGGPVISDTQRGALLQSPPELASTVTAPQLLLKLDSLANEQVLSLLGTPYCDVAVNRRAILTRGGAAENLD